MKYVVTIGERLVNIEVRDQIEGRLVVLVDGQAYDASMVRAGGQSLWSLLLDRAAYEVSVVGPPEQTSVNLRGREIALSVESEQARNARLLEGSAGKRGPATIKSVMPGRVVKVLVQPGDQVVSGQSLLILEAMKMENEIRSSSGGTVASVFVKDGQTVVNGDPLVALK